MEDKVVGWKRHPVKCRTCGVEFNRQNSAAEKSCEKCREVRYRGAESIDKECAQCGTPFTTTRFWQRFCTKKCHNAWWQKPAKQARDKTKQKASAEA